jgi:formylglycine-generating enzyme required for sulfatase activity
MSRYNLSNIRTLLTQGFSDKQLRRLCYELPDFRPVYDELAETTGKDVIVDRLIEHAERTLQVETLLALARQQNPARYRRHQPYVDRVQVEAELAKIEQGITAQESLRGLVPDEQIEPILRSLRAKQAALQAELTGSGAIAQGKKAKAVGERGVMAKKVKGDVITGDHVRKISAGTYVERQEVIQPDPAARRLEQLRSRYLTRLTQSCDVLPLADLGGDDETGDEVNLEDVYVALDTQTRVPITKAEKKKQGDPLYRAEERSLTALEAATQTPRLVLLGDPGSGKSTFVKRLTAWLAKAQLGKPSALLGWSTTSWPMLTVLRDLAPRLAELTLEGVSKSEQQRRLVGAIWQQWRADLANLGAAELADTLEDWLAGGAVLLIFDGLDEVPERLRGRVRQAVAAILESYPTIERMIITCRIRSYSGPAVLPGFTSHTLAPFDEVKIRGFIKAWYRTQVRPGRLDAAKAEKSIQDLQEAALSPDLQELAANPMLLTTMALIHQREVGLPRERVRLYNLAVQVLLNRWQKRKGLNLSERFVAVLGDDRLLRLIMERLAYEAQQQQGAQGPESDLSRRDILALLEEPTYLGDMSLADEFLDYVDQRAGLLVGRGGDESGKKPQTYNFPHRTFQEYLAGCYMVAGRRVAREYWRRIEAGDYWYLAGQLGAEELYYNRRSDEILLDLAYDLCPVAAPSSEADWRAVLWSGQMATLPGPEAIRRDQGRRDGGAVYLERLLPRLVQILANEPLRALERVEAGRVLARLGDPRPGVSLRLDGLPDITWCQVPAGPFVMGSDQRKDRLARDEERPQHTVELAAYRISRYPITQAQYAAFVQAGGYGRAAYWPEAEQAGYWRPGQVRRYFYKGNAFVEEWAEAPAGYGPLFNLANQPVVGINWYEAVAYTHWLTERFRAASLLDTNEVVLLPSEAQWEKAARGVDGRIYPWGNEADPDRANYYDTKIGSTSAVGCFPGGVSPYGCEEMSGNVWEWCRTKWQNSYADYQDDNDLEGDAARVLRGGAFSSDQSNARCAFRNWDDPSIRSDDIGFRVVVSPIL